MYLYVVSLFYTYISYMSIDIFILYLLISKALVPKKYLTKHSSYQGTFMELFSKINTCILCRDEMKVRINISNG